MKKSVLLLMTASLFVLTSCDFLRSLAGRPTSAELNATEEVDTLVQSVEADTLVAAETVPVSECCDQESIQQNEGTVLNPAELGSLYATKLEAKYYVIVGAFNLRSNAEALLKKAQNNGYQATLISFNNGLLAVGLCPSSNIADAKEALKQVKAESFCPGDVWLLLNE